MKKRGKNVWLWTLKWQRSVVVLLLQTDKASMLDEIIDYVKFLQLQVKASMNFNNVLVVVLV